MKRLFMSLDTKGKIIAGVVVVGLFVAGAVLGDQYNVKERFENFVNTLTGGRK